jgi:hypothetical protein
LYKDYLQYEKQKRGKSREAEKQVSKKNGKQRSREKQKAKQHRSWKSRKAG